MADPIVEYDLEFYFAQGDPFFATVHDGRDVIVADDVRIKLVQRPTDQEFTETIIHRQHVTVMRTTKRVIPPTFDSAVLGSGRLN
jgi:hypothetical protein